jgi:phospholipase C
LKRALFCAAALLAACGGGRSQVLDNSGTAPAVIPHTLGRTGISGSPIQHVVIVVQENRSFDNLFNGFPGANTVQSGKTSTGQTIALQPVNLAVTYDPAHGHSNWVTEYDGGRMDGFNNEVLGDGSGAPKNFAYAYVPQSQVQPYWTMAKQYALADDMFGTNEGPSWEAHLYLVAGNSAKDSTNTWYGLNNPHLTGSPHPGGCDSLPGTTVSLINPATGQTQKPGVFPCFYHQTIFDLLDSAGLSWKWYEARLGRGVWYAPDAYYHIRYGPDYANVSAPNTNFFTDLQNGNLAVVSWIMPTCSESDHATCTPAVGPSWVASIVNAIGQSKYWDSTAILITWDEWGGWYDHVAPVRYNKYELGFRVPLVVVSPYAKAGYISHYRHEFGSTLHFIESTFGLGSLNTTDARSDTLSDMFNYTQTPIPFQPIPAPTLSPAALNDTRIPDNDD